MAGSSARRRRWTTALALGLLGCCALAQTGCLHPPTTPAESLGQQLYNIQPGTPVATAPIPLGASAAGPIVQVDPNALAAQPAPPVLLGPAVIAPVVAAPQPVAAPIVNPAVESGILLSPGVVVAPVGANVVMVAGVFGPGRAMLPGQRVEWSLAAGGVGQITAVGSAPSGFFGLTTTPAQKIDPLYAVNETFSRSLVVTHGTGTPLGDLTIVRGQTWISVSSPNEGASYVTALAPTLDNWVARQQTAVIHWVDAQWSAAPPAVSPAGSRHTFTTTITRRTTGEPLAGWHVRYEITGGPAAGFAPDVAPAVEVPTNDLGQASVEILQPKDEPGINPILIQVIRPAALVPGGQRLVVGTAATEQSWTGPSPATVPANIPGAGPPTTTAPRPMLRMTGPAVATVGATASYRIEVTNSGDQPATGVVVSDPLPDGLTYLQSNPPAERSLASGVGSQPGAAAAGGANLQWTLGTLQPRENRTIQLDVRVDKPGAINHCAALRTAEGLSGQDCATTTIRADVVEMRLTGPDKGTVGQQVRFQLEIINHGETPATGFKLRDRYDDGLVQSTGKNPIEVEISPPLAPGATKTIGITFTVAKPGRLCHTVDLISPAGAVQQTTQACLDASNPAAPPKPALTVKVTGPKSVHVGETALFVIEVTNTGDAKIANVRVTNAFDDPRLLQAKEASEGYTQNGAQLTWTIDNLDPGKSTQRSVKCACLAAAPQTCDRVTLSDGAELTLGEAACLEILPAENPPAAGGKLSLTVAARANPIKIGGETSFIITVNNAGPNPERNVALAVTIPQQMQFDAEGGAQNPTKVSVVDGQTIRFGPILQLDPNKPVQFEIKAKATLAGAATLHTEATSQSTTQPVPADTTLTINPE